MEQQGKQLSICVCLCFLVLLVSSCCTVHTDELLCPFVGFVKCSLISSHLSVIQKAVLIFQFLNSQEVFLVRLRCPLDLVPNDICPSEYLCVCLSQCTRSCPPPHPDHWVILWPEKLIIPSCLCCYFRPWGPTGLGVCAWAYLEGGDRAEKTSSLSPSMSLPLSNYYQWAVGVG